MLSNVFARWMYITSFLSFFLPPRFLCETGIRLRSEKNYLHDNHDLLAMFIYFVYPPQCIRRGLNFLHYDNIDNSPFASLYFPHFKFQILEFVPMLPHRNTKAQIFRWVKTQTFVLQVLF